MDPLSCLSVASSAIQIVDFSAKLWSQIRELSESQSGASAEHERLRADAKRLCDLNSGLGKLLTPGNLQRDLTSTEQAVVSLSAECDSAAEQLTGALEKLSINGDDEDVSSFPSCDLVTAEHGRRKRKRPIERKHEVIDTNHKINELTSKSAKWDTAKSFGDWIQSRNPDGHQCQINLLNAVGSLVSRRIIDRLLMKLSFDEMFGRQERISDNFQGTFRWIYSEPQDPDKPWDSFSSWLTQGRGIYWITGKAGSGKSTLMRMLLCDPYTDELLHQWCKGDSLITAAFFFWNSGSKLQMSQEGLLRSLLQQSIEQRLRQASKRLHRKLDAFTLTIQATERIQFKELEQLFRLLVEEDDEPIKYFFLVDGLDEVDGDKSALVSLIHTLGAYPNVKICVSSRPWVVFEDGFRQQPSLMLQFLTYNDITLYVREKLTAQPAFRELAWGYPENAEELVNDVTAKASGVFLWVTLAVDSLIQGLADGDRIEDLRRRLDELPEELEELFRKMLHGLEGRYFADAARLFRIHRASKEPQLGFSQGLPLLALAFAEELTFDSAAKRLVKPLTGQEWLMRSITMKRRLSSRCNGLIEIEDLRRKSGNIWNAKDLDRLITDAGDAKTTVQYLHRTVKDYLESPEIWQIIEQAATENRPCPRTSLCLAHILLWKTFELSDSIADSQLETFKTMLERCFSSALALSTVDEKMHIKVLDTIAAAMFQGDSIAPVWNRLYITRPPEDFLCLAVHCNFSVYVRAELTQAQPRVSVARRSRLLQVAVSKSKPMINIEEEDPHESEAEGETIASEEEDCESVTSDDNKESESMAVDDDDWVGYRRPGAPDLAMVKLLLHHGADPDLVIEGISSRRIVIQRISSLGEELQDNSRYISYVLNKILSWFRDKSGGKSIPRDLAGKAKRLFK
ncbi:hypothetical protein B0T10DRAFT_608780 [Thelonectria olida]|uniref:NACHT domain-containing protein n=1 Tax=Thelonectria olida TaxID=1576542 RepID=A0A9P9AM67_9HYPO|nr:hypothetical protein B0T10DRAFT_608780 [Thelonectria olida]